MGVTTFDTLKFVRRLEQAGVPSNQAEAQAEVLTEAFNVNLEELVTKDYLAAQFAKERAYMDQRFEQVNVKFAEQGSHFKVLYWMLTIVVGATVLPLVERMINL